MSAVFFLGAPASKECCLTARAVGALPLGFRRKLQCLRTESGPSALHGKGLRKTIKHVFLGGSKILRVSHTALWVSVGCRPSCASQFGQFEAGYGSETKHNEKYENITNRCRLAHVSSTSSSSSTEHCTSRTSSSLCGFLLLWSDWRALMWRPSSSAVFATDCCPRSFKFCYETWNS